MRIVELMTNVIEYKQVDFYGDTILAVGIKDEKGNIVPYCSVKAICRNLGINSNHQIKKIKNNPLLKNKGKELTIQTNGGLQNTYCIELSAVEDWLKSINPLRTKKYTKEKKKYVYFIYSKINHLVKIGLTTNVEQRLKTLQHFSPVSIELIGVMEGDDKLEKQLHNKFVKLNHHGEWFKATKELMDYIRKNCLTTGE